MRLSDCSCGCGTCGSHGPRGPRFTLVVDGRRVLDDAPGAPAPLFVARYLLPDSARALATWARSVGLADVVAPGEMHVTLARSRSPVDWFGLGTDWRGNMRVPAGGPRRMELLGATDEKVVVLRIESPDLRRRWQELRAGGCSWDFPAYMPHVTVAGGPGVQDVSRMRAYSGELELGPEVFAPLETDH